MQLVLAFEFESGLQDTVDWCRKWLLDGNTGKNRTLFIEKKMDVFLMKNNFFKMWDLFLCPKLDWSSYIVSVAETVSNKIGALISSTKFLLSLSFK